MKKISVVSVLALTWGAPALAEESADLSADDARGGAIVVTGSRSGDPVPVDQLGASVTVLDAEALETRQTRIVSDILRDVPGVAVSRGGGVAAQTQVRIRGAEGNHVLVLIDGIEVSNPFQGEYDFAALLADPEARIEVLRGQQSSLYGSDAIGGVIHYITPPGTQAPGVSARVEGGSFGTYAGSARAAGVSGALDYAVSASYYHTDGRPASEFGTLDLGSDSLALSGKLIWSPSETFRLTAVGRYSYTKADQADIGVDPVNSPPAPDPVPGDDVLQLPIDAPDTYYRNEAFYGLLRGELALLDGRWTSALALQIADTTRDGYLLGTQNSGDRGRRLKGSAESTIRFGSGRVLHRLTAALDVEREEFRNTAPQSEAFPFFRGKRHTDSIGLVGQYELLVDERFSLGASIRHDRNDRFDDPTTFRVQGSYALPTGTRVRAAYGTGVKNPGYFELFGFIDGAYIGNPNLRPEKSTGWEIGIEQSFAEGLATIGATYFDSTLEDEIFTTYPPPDFTATPDNRDTESRQHGLEVFAAARPHPQLRVDAAYTYLKAREDGLDEVRRPRHVGSFNLTAFSPDERLSGTLTLRYNGRQQDVAFTPFFRSVRVDLKEFVLVNLAADYRLTDGITLFGRIENLIDEDYQEVFGYAGPGRTAFAGVRARF